jgi:hypothetical protein
VTGADIIRRSGRAFCGQPSRSNIMADIKTESAFDIATDLEQPITGLKDHAAILHRIAETLGDDDSEVVSRVAYDIGREAEEISTVYSRLFNKLFPESKGEDNMADKTEATGASTIRRPLPGLQRAIDAGIVKIEFDSLKTYFDGRWWIVEPE